MNVSQEVANDSQQSQLCYHISVSVYKSRGGIFLDLIGQQWFCLVVFCHCWSDLPLDPHWHRLVAAPVLRAGPTELLGLKGREGEWYWASTLTAVGRFIWSQSNQPDGLLAANCLSLGSRSGTGYDDTCTLSHYPICEKIWNRYINTHCFLPQTWDFVLKWGRIPNKATQLIFCNLFLVFLVSLFSSPWNLI